MKKSTWMTGLGVLMLVAATAHAALPPPRVVCNVNVTAGYEGSGIGITSTFTQGITGISGPATGVLTYFGANDEKFPLTNGAVTPVGPAANGFADLTYTSSQALTLVLDFKNHMVVGGMLRGDPLYIGSPNSLICTAARPIPVPVIR